MSFDITSSIVLYENNPLILRDAIKSFLNTQLNVKLYLIDNSPTDNLKELATDTRCEYIFNNSNLGFGKGHNIALRKSQSESRYHLVLNPDVYFGPGALEDLFAFMEENPNVGQVMPKIMYPDGGIQYSGKLLPTPLDLIGRRLFSNVGYFEKRNHNYELRDSGYSKLMNVPNHLGCFMFIQTAILEKAGLFDDRIFMYTEDIDLTRRIHRYSKTIYYPKVEVFHYYEKGSHKKIRLLFYHIQSVIRYFNKWGWFFDSERTIWNKRILLEYGVNNRS